MNLSLDTHVAIWAITDDPKLSANARELLLASRNIIWISSINVWEIAIKHSLDSESMPISGKKALQYFRKAGYQFLTVEPEHVTLLEELPHHHQDSFDRLLIAQALAEPMRLLTHDTSVARYSDSIILI